MISRGRKQLPNHLAEETASVSDDTTPDRSEFVLESSFQLGPRGQS